MYKIIIPSHNRVEMLQKKTLKYLQDEGVLLNLIYIFVSKNELQEYKSALGDLNINVIEGRLGLKENLNYIADYFDEGEKLVRLDDDLKHLIDKNNNKIPSLNLFIRDCFESLDATNNRMCGINPSKNPFFYTDTLSIDLKFCAGFFRCYLNTKFCEKREYTLLEDYETTIKYFNYCNGINRMNNIGGVVNYKSGKGGLIRKPNQKQKEVDKMLLQYPSHTHEHNKQDEIKLVRFPERKEVFTLWIGEEIPYLQELAIISWIRVGYRVVLYTNFCKSLIKTKLLKNYEYYIVLKNTNDILPYNNQAILPYADLFRYKVLYQEGGIWLDSDLILLKRLPNKDIIISSEHTFQSGAYKSKLTKTPNIGCLKFFKENALIKKVIDTIEQKIKNPAWKENMNLFKKEIVKSNYETEDPDMFCPVPWWNATCITNDKEYPTKYAVPPMQKDLILRNATGIHCWDSILKKKNINLQESEFNSLFEILENILI